MSLPVLSLLFFGFGVILIAVFVIFKRWDELAQSWLWLSLAVAVYALSYAHFSNNSVDPKAALFTARLGTMVSDAIPATWLNFVSVFLNVRRPRWIWIPVCSALFTAAVGMTNLFIPSVAPAGPYLYYPVPGPLYHIHAANFAVVMSLGFLLLVKCYLAEKEKSNRQAILSFGIATVCAFVAGGSEYSLIYLRDRGVDLTSFLFVYPFLMAYAMTKHRVLDVEKIADAFQREKLAALGVLAASVNHELKNPLFVAKLTLESHLEGLQPAEIPSEKTGEGSRGAVEKSLAQVDRALEIMQRLTDFAKPAVGREREQVSLVEVIDRVLELVGHQIVLEKIRLSKRVPQDLTVLASRRQLEEIFINLVLNACQAMPDGGELQIVGERGDGAVRVEISDTGRGIGAPARKRVFEPFFSTKGKEGTGLGLYITKQLVERNGGRIHFKTFPGGTSFFVDFKTL